MKAYLVLYDPKTYSSIDGCNRTELANRIAKTKILIRQKMKKSFLSIVASFILFSSQGQIEKSTWLLTGNLNLLSRHYSDLNGGRFEQLDIQIAPKVGYFLIDKLAIGLYPALSYSRYNNILNERPGTTNIQLGPFMRYYFIPKEKELNIFIESSYRYSAIIAERSDIRGSIASIGAGPVIYFNSAVGLEFGVTYEVSKSNTPNTKTTMKNIGLSVGLQVHLKNETN